MRKDDVESGITLKNAEQKETTEGRLVTIPISAVNRRTFLSMAGQGLGLVFAGAVSGHTLVGPSHFCGGVSLNYWNDLPYHDKALRLVRRAFQDRDRYVGQECKGWMRTVVYEASCGHVRLPINQPDESGWYWAPDPDGHVRQVYPDVSYFKGGQIVQMNWRLNDGSITPHTFLIYENNWVDTVRVIESNWCTGNCKIVRTRDISYNDLRQKLVYHSMYEIW
jgi:hypothetical protein